jgi:esterase/lipase
VSNKELFKIIIGKISDINKITREEVKEIVRPYHEFDAEKEREKSLNRKVNSIMSATFKDKDNIRKFYLIEVDGIKTYINIDQDQDIETLKAIRDRSERTVKGYAKSIKKLNKKIKAIEAQISIEQWQSSKLLDDATNQ